MTTLTPRPVAATLPAFMLGSSAAAAAQDRDEGNTFSARLSGYNTVHFIPRPPKWPTTPARESTAGGSLELSARSAAAGATPTCTPRSSRPEKSAANSDAETAVITTAIDNPYGEKERAPKGALFHFLDVLNP